MTRSSYLTNPSTRWPTVCLASAAGRARRPELFRQGSYVACHGSGEHRELVCAFGRDLGDQGLIAAVPLRVVRLTGGEEIAPVGAAVWGDGRLEVPPEWAGREYRNLFSGQTLTIPEGGPRLAEVFAHFPVALLEKT